MRSVAPLSRRVLVAIIAAMAAPPVARVAASNDPPPLVGFGGQYTILRPARHVGAVPIRTVTGDIIELGHFSGRVVLLNFWATWCGPCVREMPSLDRLAAQAPADLAVVPVSLDEDGCPTVARFYRNHRLAHLDMYFDVDGRTSHGRGGATAGTGFAIYGLPISYVIDKTSRVRGYIAGAVEWDSDEATALLRYYVRGSAG